jgi:hypothetical protein
MTDTITTTPVTTAAVQQTSVTPDVGSKPIEVKADTTTGDRKFKVKVDGIEQEVSEKDLISCYSTNAHATKKSQEAAAIRKQAEQFIELLQTNPLKVLQNPVLGVDLKKMSEDFLLQQYQDEIDPKGAENRRMKEQLEEIAAEKQTQREAEEQRRLAANTQKWMDHYVRDIDSAISSSKTLPQNNEAVYDRVIHYLQLGCTDEYIARNGRSASAAEVLPLVEEEFKKQTKSLYSGLSPEQLLEYFGEEIASKIRKADVARIKNPIPQSKFNVKHSAPKKHEKPKGLQDFREALEERDRNIK